MTDYPEYDVAKAVELVEAAATFVSLPDVYPVRTLRIARDRLEYLFSQSPLMKSEEAILWAMIKFLDEKIVEDLKND